MAGKLKRDCVSSRGLTTPPSPNALLELTKCICTTGQVATVNAGHATEVAYLALRLADVFHAPILELRKTTTAI